MADITTDLYNIENASRGEIVRDSIVDAIKKMNIGLTPPKPKRYRFKPKGSKRLITKDNEQFLVPE